MTDYRALARSFLEELVAFDTVNPPGSEQPLAQRIAAILSSYGFATQVETVAPNRANVMASCGESDRKLILNGHLDIVPPGEGWRHPPFAVTQENGRLYGRGACDMKGAIACMMAAAVQAKEEGLIGDQQLILLFVADEEIDGLGTKAFVRRFEKGTRNWVVIGEGTQNQVHVAHRGVVRLRVLVNGRQCHAGQPEKGINANTLMARFALAVDQLNRDMQRREQPVLPPPSISLTRMNGGIKDNVVAGSCEAILDIRTVPGDTAAKLVDEVNAILRGLFGGEEGVSWQVEPFIDVLPGMLEPTHPLVLKTIEASEKACGRKPQVTYFNGCCDMSCFCAAGFDTLICGPGSLDQAHTVDEYVTQDQFDAAVELYKNLIQEAGK